MARKIKASSHTALTPRSRPTVPGLPASYPAFLADLKSRIQAAQAKAALAVNRELITLYWHIGKSIVERQQAEGWGKNVIERLSRDIQAEFPGISGFSRQNIEYMRAFYLRWKDSPAISQQAVGNLSESVPARAPLPAFSQQSVGKSSAQPSHNDPPEPLASIPWGHNILLLQKLKDPATRLWYAQQTLAHGWSRNILALQIESKLHLRQGKAVTNFAATLPPPQSDLAQQVLKDPYVFDFLTLGPEALERQLETDLVNHITRFLLELGAGFAFVGRQVHLEVDRDDYYLDLLFYHVRLHCYVVLELKAGPFKPEHAGKMNFYLSAVDDQLRSPGDQPTIGLILCRDQKRLTAEYALRDVAKPIGVAGWRARLTVDLPKRLQGALPSVQQLQAALAGDAP